MGQKLVEILDAYYKMKRNVPTYQTLKQLQEEIQIQETEEDKQDAYFDRFNPVPFMKSKIKTALKLLVVPVKITILKEIFKKLFCRKKR